MNPLYKDQINFQNFIKRVIITTGHNVSRNIVTSRLTISVPIFVLFTELNDGTPLHVELIIRPSENLTKITLKLS